MKLTQDEAVRILGMVNYFQCTGDPTIDEQMEAVRMGAEALHNYAELKTACEAIVRDSSPFEADKVLCDVGDIRRLLAKTQSEYPLEKCGWWEEMPKFPKVGK